MWTSKDFDKAAAQICTDYMASNGEATIDDLATKLAEDVSLSPEGIRTVVRLANVSVFEKCFSKSASDESTDRMIEYEVGDANKVINRVHQNAKVAHAAAVSPVSYNQQADLFGDIAAPQEKVAGYESEDEEGSGGCTCGKEEDECTCDKKFEKEEEKLSAHEARFLFNRAHDKIGTDMLQKKTQWEDLMQKAAQTLIAQDSRITYRTAFEKNALALCGEDIVPELKSIFLRTSPRGTDVSLCGGEKVASIVNTHIAFTKPEQEHIIALIKEAQTARKSYVKCADSLKWVKEQLAGIKQ